MTAIQHNPSSSLVGLLSLWSGLKADPVETDVPGRLGDWIGAMDALRLDAALKTAVPAPAGTQAAGRVRAVPLGAVETQRLQLALRCAARAEAVKAELMDGAGQLEPVQPDVADPSRAPAPSLWAQAYTHRQGWLELRVRALRSELQQVLAQWSAWGRQLAALDAAMADAIGTRQTQIWHRLPRWLEFRAAQQPQHVREDAQALWRAEVDERMAPIWSLIDATRTGAGGAA